MIPRPSIRTYAMIAAAVLVLLTVMAVLIALDARKDAARAKAGQTLADGRTAAAQDASQVRDDNDAANQSTRNEVKEATDAVRNETDPAERDRLARERLCRLSPGACPG